MLNYCRLHESTDGVCKVLMIFGPASGGIKYRKNEPRGKKWRLRWSDYVSPTKQGIRANIKAILFMNLILY
jgi:hypothetical protein